MKFFFKLIPASAICMVLLNFCIYARLEREFNENKNSISFGAGRQALSARDMLGSPMLYSGEQNVFSLSYHYYGNALRHRLEISALRASLDASTKSTMPINLVNARYSYYRQIASLLSNKLSFYAGGTLNHISSEKSFNIAPDFMNIGSFDESTSLNLALMGEYRIMQRDKISFGLHTPFLAYVLRPNYSLFPRDVLGKYDTPVGYFLGEGRFRTINDIFGLTTWVSAEKSLSRLFALRLNYNFLFYRIKSPAESSIVSNSLNINIAYLF